MKNLLRCAATVAGMVLAISAAAADSVPPRYGVRVLADVVRQTFPVALNNKLQVATVYNFDHPIPTYAEDHFVDFNNRGEQLGWSFRECCGYIIKHPYLIRDGNRTWLDGLREGNAINDHSVIAGAITGANSSAPRAVLYDGTGYTELGTLGGEGSSATDVNNLGEAIGWAQTESGAFHPFLYRDGVMHDLSLIPGWLGTPNAINDHGQMVVSYYDAAFLNHLRFYSNGMFQEIVAPGPQFFFSSLNNLGQVLLYRPNASPGSESILWQDGHAYELLSLIDPSANYRFSPATDINDNGQILIRGCSFTDGNACSILMLEPIPEPSTWAMLLAGLGMLALIRRQGRHP